MKKKISLGMALTLIIMTVALTFSVTMLFASNRFNFNMKAVSERQKMYNKLSEIDNIARQNYYKSIDETKLNDMIAAGYTTGLGDDYTSYMTAEQYASTLRSQEGLGIGIGITTVEHPDTHFMYVVSVSKDSPADKAGIKKGDQITTVNSEDVLSLGYSKTIENMLGEVNTKCRISVLRDGKNLNFELTRKEYTSSSIEYRMIDRIGYIKITTFNSGTVDQFKDAVKALQASGAVGLVYDVRHNPGGTLDSVSKILDFLLPKGDIVSAVYKDGKREILHQSDASEVKLPMAVLVDQNTASAAELFSAAIRDYHKGRLVGSKTFGKGVMQRTYELSDKSAVRITIAEFNPPSGKNFNKIGLEPDIKVDLTQEQKNRFYLLSDKDDPVILAGISAALKDAGKK